MSPSPGRRRADPVRRRTRRRFPAALLAVAALAAPGAPLTAASAAPRAAAAPLPAAAPLAAARPGAPATPGGLAAPFTGAGPATPAAGTSPAAATGPEPAQVSGGLRLISQTPLVDPNGTFEARIDISSLAQAGATTVDISIYSVLADDTGLYRAPSPSVRLNQIKTKKLTALPVDANGVLTVDVPIRSGDTVVPDRVKLPDPGVYPVVVSLNNTSGVVGSIRLNLIRLPQAATNTTTGQRSVAATLAVGGTNGLSLQEATDLLRLHPRVPVTVLLGRGVLGQLQSDPTRATAFAAAAGSRLVLATMDPDLDPSALAAVGQGDLYRNAVQAMIAQLQALGLTPLPRTVVITAPLTADGADLVASTSSTAVELPGSPADATTSGTPAAGSGSGSPTTAPGTARATASWARLLTTPTGSLTVAHLDPGPAPTVTGETRGSLLAAQRQLARVMLRNPKASPLLLGGFAAAPAGSSTGSSTGTPAATPSAANGAAYSDPAFLDLLLSVLGQAGTPPLNPLTLVDATQSTTGAIEPAEAASQDLSSVVDAIEKTENLLKTYEGYYADGPLSAAVYRSRLNQALGLDQPDDTRAVLIDGINTEINQSFSQISVPDGQSVTMAARRAEIPLTVENASEDSARYVRLRVTSDNKLLVTDPDKIIRIEPGTNSIDMTVQARSLGESPLRVSILTPDGRPLATTVYRVRSTSFPGLGVLITVFGLAALGVWWYLGFKRKGSGGRRRHREPEAGGEPDRQVRLDLPGGTGPGGETTGGTERLPAHAGTATRASVAGAEPADPGGAQPLAPASDGPPPSPRPPQADRPRVLATDSVDP